MSDPYAPQPDGHVRTLTVADGGCLTCDECDYDEGHDGGCDCGHD